MRRHGIRRRSDRGKAFLADPGSGPARAHDALAERLAEAFLETATSGEQFEDEEHEGLNPTSEGMKRMRRG